MISNQIPEIEYTWNLHMRVLGYSSDDIYEALDKCNGDESAAELYLKEHYKACPKTFDSRFH